MLIYQKPAAALDPSTMDVFRGLRPAPPLRYSRCVGALADGIIGRGGCTQSLITEMNLYVFRVFFGTLRCVCTGVINHSRRAVTFALFRGILQTLAFHRYN